MSHETNQKDGRWVGQRVSFDGEAGGPHAGKVLVGIVEASKFIGLTQRGKIPNWCLSVRGASGKLLEVDLVEQYARFPSE